jgi:hypothetical protein
MPAKKRETAKDIEYTKRFSESKKTIEANEKKGLTPKGVNVSKGSATAKPYEKKFLGGRAESSNKKIPTDQKRTKAIIVDGKGKSVKVANKGNEQLYREYKRDSTNTMNMRNKNANFYNVQTGAKKNMTNSDKKILVDLKKAKFSS